MEISLESVKAYCRIDGDQEDGLLRSLIGAAKDYLANAGVDEPAADSPLYALAVKGLVLHFYDERGLTGQTALSLIPGMRNAITQLKLKAEAERIAAAAEEE